MQSNYQSSPPRDINRYEANQFGTTNITSNRIEAPQLQGNINFRAEDEVSRSVYANSGQNNSPLKFNANVNTVGGGNYGTQGNYSSQINTQTTNYSPNRQLNYDVNYNTTNQFSPVKTGQYEANYQVNQSSPQSGGLNINANYQGQGSTGGSTYGSSSYGNRSYTVSSSSSFGRYPLGMPVGGVQIQQPNLQFNSQFQQGSPGRRM
ncbi:MAG: hypothetical protein KDD45_12370 [Bdellovibrionales bacterium]|nr:hypothetical protein [Bdellovibrionales bacterium]